MAEPPTPLDGGQVDLPSRSFSRQALEATLAEALRDVESGGPVNALRQPSLTGLGASRAISGLASPPEAPPAEPAATIALRRPPRSEPEPASETHQPAPAPAPPKAVAAIPAWLPTDDDILPRASVRRRSFRRR
jgi:hypothetical protein